ncbi:MAG: hypothetical protein KAS13_01950 [Candidatus Omnitrophica bacterium]|nr:hypothetical protein [Candidatus Omnitrophota bacterium]
MKNIISRFSKREKAVFFAAIVFVSFSFADRVILSPILKKMKVYSQEIKAAEYDMLKNSKILQQRARIEEEEKRYAKYSILAKTDEEETATLLREIERLATRSAIYLNDLKPSGIQEEGLVKKFKVNVSCEGDMEKIILFMHLIEDSHIIMQIAAFDMGPKSTQSKINRCDLLISKIVIP